MPNYVWNTIKTNEETIKKMLNEKGEFDFNTFVKRPDEIAKTVAGGFVKELIALHVLENYSMTEFEKIMCDIDKFSFIDISGSKKKIKETLLKRLDGETTDQALISRDEVRPALTGKDYFELYQKYGDYDWYGWDCKHWGTKWNAFDVSIDDECISFDTAWNAPMPIFQRVCEMFPDEQIEFDSEYEDDTYYRGRNSHGLFEIIGVYLKDRLGEDGTYDDAPWVNVETGNTLVFDQKQLGCKY